MKRRTFLKAAGAFLAAPLAFFGAKKVAPVKIPHNKDVNFTYRHSTGFADWRYFYGSNA